MRWLALLGGAALTLPAFAAVPYLTDKLAAIDSSRWSMTGSLTAGETGLAAQDAEGGSLISRMMTPDGSAEAEVRATVALTASGGTYTAFAQATPDARTSGSGAGSYVALEMRNPTFGRDGRCTADFLVLQSIAGTVSLLSSFSHACRNGMELRLAVRGNLALAWPDQETPMEFTVVPSAGRPGIGAASTPSGNGISNVRLAAIAHTPPVAIDRDSIGISAFRNHIDVQWRPAGNETGYRIYRDGAYLMRVTAPNFSDETVAAGRSYTYTIHAVDEHRNLSPGVSISATAPGAVSAPVSGRR